MVELFEIHFKSLFFDIEKRRQCSEVTAIPWEQTCSREMLLGCIAIGISGWLTSNRMVSCAFNDKLDSWQLKELTFPRPKESENYDAP